MPCLQSLPPRLPPACSGPPIAGFRFRAFSPTWQILIKAGTAAAAVRRKDPGGKGRGGTRWQQVAGTLLSADAQAVLAALKLCGALVSYVSFDADRGASICEPHTLCAQLPWRLQLVRL